MTATHIKTASSITLRELVAAMPIVMLIGGLREAFAARQPAHLPRAVAAT